MVTMRLSRRGYGSHWDRCWPSACGRVGEYSLNSLNKMSAVEAALLFLPDPPQTLESPLFFTAACFFSPSPHPPWWSGYPRGASISITSSGLSIEILQTCCFFYLSLFFSPPLNACFMLMRLITLHRLLDAADAKEGKKKKKITPFAQFAAFYVVASPSDVFFAAHVKKYTIGVMCRRRPSLGLCGEGAAGTTHVLTLQRCCSR